MPEPEIANVYPLVHNKVLSPHFVNPTLRRERLIDWLNEHATCRAMVIAADAGYGKTTLVWQWEREVPFDCYWYKLDRNDRDWSLQISYLIEAVSQRHEGFGRRTNSMLQQIGAASATGRATVTAYLISELNERLREPATFIIDDWQFVASVTEVRAFWNQMLRDAPANCRFLFLARAKPQLQFARFTTHAGYAELRTDALRFNEEEIRLLFEEVYRDPLDPQELVEIERRTEGWAASLQLIEVSLRERKTPEERRAFIESITATRDSDLFNFLAEEVLDQQTDQTRNFLLCTSILTQITPELAERMTGVVDGRKLLNELEQRGLFTYRLDPETIRYRYHGLFRDFLERCLKQERTEAEVIGLHIHAASYYETTSQWPDAIHHYLAAGLTSQASRLIARYGEDVVAGGRLGLVDEWLQQIPQDAIRSNARLSLLWGETLGMRGDWKPALATLERARKFFHRKGDARMEALSCVKLSTVRIAEGAVDVAARLAKEGLAIVPDDAALLRLRLEGNYALSGLWAEGRIDEVAIVCRRIAASALDLDSEHYAAIAFQNLGILLRESGQMAESSRALGRAAETFDAVGRSPYPDHSDLVITSLILGHVEVAERMAERGVRNTSPWPRPQAEALYGQACVDIYKGDFSRAIERLEALVDRPLILGGVVEAVAASLFEAYRHTGARPARTVDVTSTLASRKADPRQDAYTCVAMAVAAHNIGRCVDHCRHAASRLEYWERCGALWPARLGRVKLAILGFEHNRDHVDDLVAGVRRFEEVGSIRYLRHWLRGLLPYLPVITAHKDGPGVLAQLLESDPEFWRQPAVDVLGDFAEGERKTVLRAISKTANRSVIQSLGSVPGEDIAEVRRSLVAQHASRIYVRTFGSFGVYRASWKGQELPLDRKNPKALLGLLVAAADTALARDQVMDKLWPESAPAAASNSLNQTVFQLRRAFAGDPKPGDDAPYVVATTESIRLQPQLVITDLAEFRRLADAARNAGSAAAWTSAISSMIDLIRGDFLGELRYEDWAAEAQPRIHAEIRHALLPIALGRGTYVAADLGIRAASALIALDPFDEQAYLAIADRLAESGRRVAARELITRYARKLRSELDEPPSADLLSALTSLGAPSIEI